MSRTCTSLRVARLDRVAYTILPTICRRTIAASSVVSAATTSFTAYAEPRPFAVKCTVAFNTICNTTDRRCWHDFAKLINQFYMPCKLAFCTHLSRCLRNLCQILYTGSMVPHFPGLVNVRSVGWAPCRDWIRITAYRTHLCFAQIYTLN